MRRRVLSALLALCGPAVLAVSGCSSGQEVSTREPIAQQRLRLGGATKNCQLIGDWDRSVYPRIPTKVPTFAWYGVEGTDLGYPVSDGQRLWFFFGDMFASNPPGETFHTAPDPLGYTWDLTLPADGCPTMDFEYDPAANAFKPQRLDGSQLYGFEVPSGAVFDADNQRFIAGFMKSGGGPNVFSNVGVLGTSLAAAPTEFASAPGVMDRLQLLLVAPAIVPASEVANWAQLGVTSPTEKVLLLWGTKQPYRNSAVYLAAAPLASFADPAAWKVLDGTSTWSDPLAASPAPVYPPEKVHIDPSNPDAPYLQGIGCVGEFSVNYNPVFRKWMMLYVCGSDAGTFSQGRGTKNGAVYLRTAEKPVGPWSPAIPLFRPKPSGHPVDGDDGSFVHAPNPRIYRTYENGVAKWHWLPQCTDPNLPCWDSPFLGREKDLFPAEPPQTACPDPSEFPADCPSAAPQDPDDPAVGCCTNKDLCCDRLFEKHTLEGMGSYAGAGIYASYLIQEYSEALDGSGTTPPTHQRIHYVLSTWQPYTVVLMSAELHDDDIDNDGVLDDEDNCKSVYNPKQENCNLAAELDGIALGRNTQIMGDACDPVPCPTGSADRIVTKHLVAGSCTEDMWEASVCIGRAVRSHIDVSPVGSSPTEEVQQAYDFKQPINIPQPNERMDARFCQNRLPDYRCADVSKRRDQVLWAYGDTTPDDEVLDEQRIWHRVTLNCGARPPYTCPTPFLPRGQDYSLDYGTERRSFAWDYQRDSAYWNGTPIGEPPNPRGVIIPQPAPGAPCTDTSAYGAGTCLDGMFWTHGYWDWGQWAPGAGLVEWAYDGAEWREVGTHGIELSNSFFPAAPDRTFAWAYGGVRAKPLFWLVFTLPDPPPVWQFFDGSRVPIVFDNREPEAAFDDGHRAAASEVFTAEALSALQTDGMTWVAAVEASPYAGVSTRPIGIGLRNRGSGMEARATLVWTGAQVDVGPALSATSSGPRPRTEPLTAYSKSRAKLFVAGGRDVATGELANDVWMLDAVTGDWKTVAPDTPLRELTSMTYSYRERVLWILDRGLDAGVMTTRLLRIEPDTGTTQVVVEAQQREASPRYGDRYLGTDADGRLVLTASSALPQRHEIALLETIPGTYAVSTTGCRARSLATAAVNDLRGYALYYQPQTEVDSSCLQVPEPPPTGAPAQRIVELPLASATLGTIRGMLE